jgi:hypothetical protein
MIRSLLGASSDLDTERTAVPARGKLAPRSAARLPGQSATFTDSGLDSCAARMYVLSVAHPSGLTDERLGSLYDAEGFGGERTMRAKVIHELIDEIRLPRFELLRAEARPEVRRALHDDGP